MIYVFLTCNLIRGLAVRRLFDLSEAAWCRSGLSAGSAAPHAAVKRNWTASPPMAYIIL